MRETETTTTVSANQSLLCRRQAAVPRGVAQAFPIHPVRALNAEIWDADGKRYIDFATGIAVVNTGHLHPRVKAAVAAQMELYSHVAFQVMAYEPYIELAERLNALAPGDFPKKTILFSTGAEAVENAVKIARAATGRPAVIAFSGAFHGRTMMTLAMTGKVAPYKAGFGPLPGEVYHAPFPSGYHGVSADDSLAAIEALFKADIEPSRVAAIFIEPVQGEGGFNVASPEFLRSLRALCDTHGILLVADEVQAGFARTGKMFGIEHSGVVPDLITVAKSIAGGMPLSGVIGKASIMDAPAPGGLGGTYGGNPVACAAALAVLDVIEDENLCARATHIGEVMENRFRAMAAKREFACIGDIRGIGAMRAIELVSDRATRAPATALAKATTLRALANGLVLLTCGPNGNALRFLAPLTIPDELLHEGLDILENSLAEALNQNP
jgi:4-aminobutyrate aminotransferase/(S)-3-amino-2-methylpropionate transaminase